MPLNSVLVILRFCIWVGDIWERCFILNVLAQFGRQATLRPDQRECFSRKLWILCSFAPLCLFSLTLKIPDYLGQSAERRLAVKGFLASCSLRKIWYAPQCEKQIGWNCPLRKSSLFKIYIPVKIILKHFALLRAGASEIIFLNFVDLIAFLFEE